MSPSRCHERSRANASRRRILTGARRGLALGAALSSAGKGAQPQPCSPRVADYYSPAMLGLKTDQEVLGELVRTKLPAVAALMDRHGVLWTLVVSRWFICLFVDVLPVEVSVACASRGPGPCEPPAGDAPFLFVRRRCSGSGTVCSAKARRFSFGWP